MANTVVGFSINIDGIQSIDQLNSAIKETQKALNATTDAAERLELGKKLAKLTAEQKAARKNQDDLNKSLLETSGALGAYDKLSAKLNRLRKEYKDLEVSGKGGAAGTKELLKEIQALDQQLKDTDAKVGQFQRNVGNYGDALKDVSDKFGGFGGAAGQAISGLQGIGVAAKVALGPIGLLIGVISLIVASIKAFFTSSEEGQNTLKRLQAIFNVVFNNIRDILAGFGKLFVSAFENPKKLIADFGNLIVTNIVNRLKGLLELLPALGTAISQLFKGEFEKAGKTAGDAVAKVALGVENFTDKANQGIQQLKQNISDLNTEMQREIAIGVQLANQQAALDKQSRATLVANARLTQQVADLRNKFAQKDKFENEERLKFLDQAIKLEEQILRNNESIAAQKLKIKSETNKLSNSTKEDLDEEAQLTADLINLRTDNLNKTKELAAQRVEALNAIKAEEEKAANEEKKRQEELDKTRKKFLEDDVKFTEAAAKLNADILSKTNKLVTGLIEDEFMKRRQVANENFANDVKLTEEQIALRKKENEKRLADIEQALGKESEVAIKIREEITNEEKQVIDSFDKFRIEREKQLVNELAVIKGDEVKATLDAEEAKRKAIEETNEKIKEQNQKQIESLNENIQKAGQLLQLATETLDGFFDASDEKRLKRLEKDEEANQQIQENLNERLQTATGLERRFLEQQLDANKRNAEQLAKQKEKIEKESAKRKKATAIIESVINTALAVSSALATPPAPNVVAALIAGIAGAAQTAVIAAQPLAKGGVVGKGDEIVQFANGGRVTSKGNIKPLSNGDNVLATLKTGEIVLNESQQRRIGYSTLKKAQIPNFANGGLVGAPSTLITNANNTIANEQMRVNLMDEMISATNNRIDRLTVVYTATTDFEVEKGRNDKKTIKANSTF